MTRLVRPHSLSVDIRRARELGIVGLYAGGDRARWSNLLAGKGGQILSNNYLPLLRYEPGPGGMGLRTTANIYEGLYSPNTADYLPYGHSLTLFCVASVRALGTDKAIIRTGGGNGAYSVYIAADSTNGFSAFHKNSGLTISERLSVGAAPVLNRPYAIVARFSGTSHLSEQSLHVSDGFHTERTPTIASFNDLPLTTARLSLGGMFEHAEFDGFIYSGGLATRLWSREEVNEYLGDPYYFLRSQAYKRVFLPATGGATAADMNAAAGAATTSTMVGASTAATAMSTATGAATASTMVGSRIIAANMNAAAGAATTSTMVGAALSVAAGNMSAAAGAATTSTMVGSSTAAASMNAAAGVATAATMVGSSTGVSAASMNAAAGVATASTMVGSALGVIAANMNAAAGTATASTMTGVRIGGTDWIEQVPGVGAWVEQSASSGSWVVAA